MTYIAIVGSRAAGLDQLELMIRLGRTYQDLGAHLSSGDAYGADRAGWYGAIQSPRYDPALARIYVLDSRLNRGRATMHGFKIAEEYSENWTAATAMALEARGSWNGLNTEYKRNLHIRNVYQILGHTFNDHVRDLIYCAEPIGNPLNEKVKGGTNTALQVAKMVGVPNRINLYTKEGFELAENFLKKYELDYPYEDIDWRQILDPTDPRLEYL